MREILMESLVLILALLLLSMCSYGCQSIDHEFACIRGIAFVRTNGGGIAWIPDQDGKPVTCAGFGGDDIIVPEEPQP